ncbi:hypothetical protein [Zavarzinia sp. CC-PAN008]|uniref:hypothetical protein n=1 Tax=Zavarzinia sp. CC-PAN008 TaxID=3243332 RepID=UPI003F744345
MILTPIETDDLPTVLDSFADRLEGAAARAFARIAASGAHGDYDLPDHRLAATTLAARAGIPTRDERPEVAFSWDGTCIRTRSEASVIVHEVAHWLLCPPERRSLPDFGLGAGPESGRAAEADACRCVDEETRQREECEASLLGILWEAELGQPAIHAFLEQNWLEGWERPAAAQHFARTLASLQAQGLAGADGRPRLPPSI